MSLPTGTVTFLFTDIEGSTRLMQELGDAYVETQLTHHKILRAAFQSTEGSELRTEGDSFFCVFKSAINGCAAAAKAQRDFATTDWPGGKPIRVRMGLHTGEAPLVGEEYIGLDVHHAARVAGAAHGGEVVISDATKSLVEPSLPPGLSVRDLGMHRLKDLARPERLFQLVIEGATTTFPALRTLDSTPNNLPTQLTSFVGRDAEVAQAERLLRGTHLLTITGPGGMGKTRLSLQLAAEVASSFPGGTYFVPLSAVSDPGLIPSVIAQVIGLPISGNSMPLDVVIDHLRGKQVLLVLDNLEQLVPGSTPLISDLLRRAPDAKVVVTSRAVLRVYGEQEMPLEPLRLPDLKTHPPLAVLSQFEGVRLFIERAVAAKPDFQVTNENAPAVAGICERVDGLPLAIELAAARVKLFSPQALLSRLNTSMSSVLAGGARDLPGRQQTLRGAIDWSYDLLDEPHRRLFTRFAVFARGANLEQAEAVCGPASELGVDVLTGLDELADQSLVRRMPDFEEPRVLMLQVIREDAMDRLQEGGEANVIFARHADAYQALAETAGPHLFGAEQKKWLDRLEIDHDNFRAAFDWAMAAGDARRAMGLGAAFWRFWHMRGHLREGRARLEAILAMPGSDKFPVERARALEAAGGVAHWQGDVQAEQAYYDKCLELAKAGGDKAAIANALYNASFPRMVSHSDLPGALALAQQATPLYRELGDETGVARSLWSAGNVLHQMRRIEEANVALDESILLFRKLDDRFSLGWANHTRILTAVLQGDTDMAWNLTREALEIFSNAGDLSGIVILLDDAASLAKIRGQETRAITIAGAAAAQQQASGATLASVINVLEGRAWQDIIDTPEEKEAWSRGQAMTVQQAVEYALAG